MRDNRRRGVARLVADNAQSRPRRGHCTSFFGDNFNAVTLCVARRKAGNCRVPAMVLDNHKRREAVRLPAYKLSHINQFLAVSRRRNHHLAEHLRRGEGVRHDVVGNFVARRDILPQSGRKRGPGRRAFRPTVVINAIDMSLYVGVLGYRAGRQTEQNALQCVRRQG